MGEDKILTLRVLPTEDSQVGSTEVGSGPFAFDGDWLVGPASQDDVNFVARFVPPIRDLTALLAAQMIWFSMKCSTAQQDPPVENPASRACRPQNQYQIRTPWRRYNLGRPMSAERTNHRCDEGGLQRIEGIC
jgi:hypothetical protein